MFTSNPNLSFSQEGEPEITQPTEADLWVFFTDVVLSCVMAFFFGLY